MSSYPVLVSMLPTQERELYIDQANLPDPLDVNIPIFVSNPSPYDLYVKVKIKNPSPEWVQNEQNVGLVGAEQVILAFITFKRYKPSLIEGERTEPITLSFEFYTDENYTDLLTSKDFDLTLYFVDHTDPAWSILDIDNFDQGDYEGWSLTFPSFLTNYLGTGQGRIRSNYNYIRDRNYLSPPYSLGFFYADVSTGYEACGVSKTFSVPSGISKCLITMHFYKATQDFLGWNTIMVSLPDDTLYKILWYKSLDVRDKWVRVCGKLKIGVENTISFIFYAGADMWFNIYLDDIVVFYK